MKCVNCKEEIIQSLTGWRSASKPHRSICDSDDDNSKHHEPEPTEAAPSTDCVKDFGGYPMGTYKGKLYSEPEREAVVEGQPPKGGTYLNCPFTNCKSVSDCKLNGYCCSSITEPQISTPRLEMGKDALRDFVEQAQSICESATGPSVSDISKLRRLGKIAFPQGFKTLAAASGTDSAPKGFDDGLEAAASLIERVCEGCDCEHSRKYAELIRKRKSQPSTLTQAGPVCPRCAQDPKLIRLQCNTCGGLLVRPGSGLPCGCLSGNSELALPLRGREGRGQAVKLPVNVKRIALVRDLRMLDAEDWPDDMPLEKLYMFCLATGFPVEFFRQDDPPEMEFSMCEGSTYEDLPAELLNAEEPNA